MTSSNQALRVLFAAAVMVGISATLTRAFVAARGARRQDP